MKYLMVSSYPPMKCGIGSYAFQMVKRLESEGNIVDILSPNDGNGTFKTDLNGGFNVLRLINYSHGYDKIIIQYHESFFFSNGGRIKQINPIKTQFAFIILFFALRHRIEVIIHEIPYSHPSRIIHFLEILKWYACPRIIFHTQVEVDRFSSSYFLPRKSQYAISEHNRYFIMHCDEPKTESRRKLNLSPQSVIFLCIGFIQPHKGFDRALEAFRGTSKRMELYIVGSLRLETPVNIGYLDHLKMIAEQTENICVVDKYLSDEEFDLWINASDVVVIPYREIWSSSVLARAKLFKKPVIACKTGGLENQITGSDLLFKDDSELREIFADFSAAVESSCGNVIG